jgi:hypothetical protein
VLVDADDVCASPDDDVARMPNFDRIVGIFQAFSVMAPDFFTLPRVRGAARQVAQALNDEATFLLLQMANFAAQAKNRDGFAPEWRPVEQIRRICGGIRRD